MASKVEQLKRALAPTIIEAMDDDASPAILKVVPIDRAPAAQQKPIKEGDLTYIPAQANRRKATVSKDV